MTETKKKRKKEKGKRKDEFLATLDSKTPITEAAGCYYSCLLATAGTRAAWRGLLQVLQIFSIPKHSRPCFSPTSSSLFPHLVFLFRGTSNSKGILFRLR